LVSGGVTNNFATITNEGFVYTPGTNAWTTLPNSNNTLYRGGSACGFYKIGGSSGGFAPVVNSELLPGYSPCGTSPIPWLAIRPATGTATAGGSTKVKFVFRGAGQQEFTTSKAYVLLQGTPYAPQEINLQVHWDPQPIDLAVFANQTIDKIYVGGIDVFTVKVKNLNFAGHGPASQATLTYPLPAGANVLNMQGDGTCSLTSGVATCTFPTMALGSVVTEKFFVVPSVVGTMTSTFSVTAREPDDNLSNNTATLTTTVVGVAHVTLDSFTVSRGTMNVGDQVTFNLGVSNKGPGTATDLTATVPLPAYLKYVSSTASSGSCNNKGGLVTCNLGELAKGSKGTVSITATANSAGKVSTMAILSTSSRDPKMSNRSATTSVTVNAATAPRVSGGGSKGGG